MPTNPNVFLFFVSISFVLFLFRTNKENLRHAHTLSMTTMTTTTMTTTIAMPTTDINALDDDGRTKIYLAAEAGDAAEVARFLELNADFELPATGFYRYLSLFNDKNFINLYSF